MRKNLLLSSMAGAAMLVMYAGSHSSLPLRAQAGVALTGLVISEEEDRMEGVVVTGNSENTFITSNDTATTAIAMWIKSSFDFSSADSP